MEAYIIEHLKDGKIEPSSSHREGIWRSISTAKYRIKMFWHPWYPEHRDWPWSTLYEDNRPWSEKRQELETKVKKWRQENPFEEWWPKHFRIKQI